MKCTIIVFWVLILTFNGVSSDIFNMSLEEVKEKCSLAMTGEKNPAFLKSVRWSVKYEGHNYAVQTDLLRPNMFCNKTDTSKVLYNKGHAVILRQKGGSFEKQPVKTDELGDFVAEPGLFFPAIWDYPTKLKGLSEVEGVKKIHLLTTLPHNVKIHYYLNDKTFLPELAVAEINNKEKSTWKRRYRNYRKIKSCLLPFAFEYSFNTQDKVFYAEIICIEINTGIKVEYFNLP